MFHVKQSPFYSNYITNAGEGIIIPDWKAAGEMSPNGSFAMSLIYNKERFNLSPEMVKILENTGREMGWIP